MALSRITSRMAVLALLMTVPFSVPAKDEAKAAQELAAMRAAAEQGDANAQARYGFAFAYGSHGLTQDETAAANWWAKAAQQNDTDAMRHLAGAKLMGRGIDKDEDEAFELYARCSDLGDFNCTRHLATHHYTGRLIPQDLPEAERLMELAFKQSGDNSAITAAEFARFYLSDRYAPKSPEKARAWLDRCASDFLCQSMRLQLSNQ